MYSLRQQSGFVNNVLLWARQQETLRIVDNQVGSPTWARMLAEVTAQVLAQGIDTCSEKKGLYHLAGSGFASRFEWAKLILALDPNQSEQVVKELLPAFTSEFPTPARRPLLSALNCSRFEQYFNLFLPSWQSALRLAIL